MIDLGLFFLIVWVLHNAAVDVSCAIKGTENPRYALKKQKALAAGKTPSRQPRYGSRDWFADFASDALAANTERRRAKAAKKAKEAEKQAERDERPLDDLAEAVREEPQRPAARVNTTEFPEFESSVEHDADQPADVLRFRLQRAMDRIAAQRAEDAVTAQSAPDEPTDNRPDAVIIPFPNPHNTVKEISMATSEVNGLTTALAFAQAAADAHNSFATGGSEGYTGALAGWEVGDRCVGLAREAQEASQIAAAKWQAHVESLEEQLKVKEAYQGAPDAGNKQFLLNG